MAVKNVSIALERFSTFGDLLKYLRRREGLTQRELSIAVGYSDTQISRLEQNERMPDLATLTARFLPVLHVEDQPEIVEKLLDLAATMRREDAPAVGLPPYKGLQYFDETDAELFFGREALTAQLLDQLYARLESGQRFLAVIGASGSGKSSLARAGLIPALRWQPASSGWPVLVMTPSAHPLEALAAALQRELRQSTPARKIADELARDPQALSEYLKRVCQTSGAAHTILISDQFEELFTLCRSETERAGFVESLMDASLRQDGEALIVIVMRADFYAHCAGFNRLRQALAQHQEYIGPMRDEELRRAIEAPAQRGHWELEPGTVELLLHDIGADAGHTPEPGALPLLSHALLATWQRRRGRVMTLSGYTASGGVRGAIAETAEAVFYDQLEPEQREIARKIFLRLTELGGDASIADTRRRVGIGELELMPNNREDVQEVIQALADARLITTDRDSAEVAHEALIREWPTLRGWLEEDREGLRLQRRLTESAQEWDALDRDPELLYRGARLAQAIEWFEAHPDDVNRLEQDFLEASQAFQQKENSEREAQRQNELEAAKRLAETERARAEEQLQSSQKLRRRAVFLTAALFALGIVAAAALLFWRQAMEANRLASSRELAAAAVSQLPVDPERSALLAMQALDDADTLEARNALHQAIPQLHLLLNIPAHAGGVPDTAWSPDGERIATMGARGDVNVWEAGTGELLLTLDGGLEEAGAALAFSPDGTTLAASWATQVVLWDLRTGEVISRLTGKPVGASVGYNLGVGQIGFSPDGGRLAVANLNGSCEVWDLANRTKALSLPSEGQPAKAIAFSPDGRRLATAGDDGIVRIWDAAAGTQIQALPLGGVIHSVAFSSDGSFLGAASEDGGIKIWDAATGMVVTSPPRQSGLYDIAFMPDGRFVTAGQDGTARVWDSATGEQLLVLAGPTSTVISVAGSPDGRRIASGAYDGSLRIWDAGPGRELLTIQAHDGIVWETVFSPDGKRIASAGVDGRVKLWEAETGRQQPALAGGAQGEGFSSLATSADGTRLAAGSVSGTILVWDSGSGEQTARLSGHTNMVVGLAFSPDGKRLASAAWDGTAKVWDLAAGEEITTFRGHKPAALVTGIVFTPDGKTVITGADDQFVYQWDATSGAIVRAYPGDGKEIYGVAVSADGRLLAAGDQDGSICLWSVASGEQLRKFPAHAGLILRLAFNQDGSQLASAGFDRLAKIWDVKTGAELFSLYGNASNVFGVSFDPDGNRLATAGADGTVRTYTLQLEALIDLARIRLTRTLTQEECQKYLHITACPR